MFEIRPEVVKHFSDIFKELNIKEPNIDRLYPDKDVIHSISKDDNFVLSALFSL